MATMTSANLCVKCDRKRSIVKCAGCLQRYCYNDFGNHRQELNKQLDEIDTNQDQFRQSINGQISNVQDHPLIQQINQWETESIEKIKRTADEARQLVFNCTHRYTNEIGKNLNNLNDRLKQGRKDSDFLERDLTEWNERLLQLKEEFNKPRHVKIEEEESSSTFIKRISVIVTYPSLSMINIKTGAKWIQNGSTVAGNKGYGNNMYQLYCPWDVYVDYDQTIFITDQSNNRIMQWNKGATVGQVIAGGKGGGNRNDQLYYPSNVIVDKKNEYLIISDRGNQRIIRWPLRNGKSGEIIIPNVNYCGLAIDNDGCIYLSDLDKHEVKRYQIGETSGTVVAGGNGPGYRHDQFNGPYFIFVDDEHSIYVSDYYNHRVMKWTVGAKEGLVVAGGNRKGNRLDQLSGPRGLVVDHMGTVYVVDQGNDRVMRWLKGSSEGTIVVGGNGKGRQANQFSDPVGLAFDRENNLYIVDSGNHRVQQFRIDPISNL